MCLILIHNDSTSCCQERTIVVRVFTASCLPVILWLGFGFGLARADLVFHLSPMAGMDSRAVVGFTAAAQLWSNVLSNNMTVNIDIGFTSLGAGVLGQTELTESQFSYTNYRNALASRATSASDALAVASLSTNDSFNLLINGTTNNASPHVISNDLIAMTTANAKVLGLVGAANTATDATITFNSDFNFEFNPPSVTGSSRFDFVGVAAHEIGHALGFISGVDALDGNFNALSDSSWNGSVTPLDTFRMSTRMSDGTIDWTADTQAKYLSLDHGATSLGAFATGEAHGDGYQASHWKEQSTRLGIMSPTVAAGERLAIGDRDKLAMDVIGYQIVPEPSSVILLGVGGVLVAVGMRKRAAGR